MPAFMAWRARANSGGPGAMTRGRRCRFCWGQGMGTVLQLAPALAVFISPLP